MSEDRMQLLDELELRLFKAKVDYLGYTTKYISTAGGDEKKKYFEKAKRRKKEWFDLSNVHCFNLIEIVRSCVEHHPDLAPLVESKIREFNEKIAAKVEAEANE